MPTFFCFRRERLSDITWPVALNVRSDCTEDPGIHKIFSPIPESGCKSFALT